jgi:hypothetical protein
VNSTGFGELFSMLPNHAKPWKISTAQRWFSGRDRQYSSPLAINDQPTRTTTGTANGSFGTPKLLLPWWLRIQATPAPASTPVKAVAICPAET